MECDHFRDIYSINRRNSIGRHGDEQQGAAEPEIVDIAKMKFEIFTPELISKEVPLLISIDWDSREKCVRASDHTFVPHLL